MEIVVYRSTDFPIEEVASDLVAHDVVVFVVSTRHESPPLNVQLQDALDSHGARGPAVVHGQIQTVDGDWFDHYFLEPVAGFDGKTAPDLIGKAVAKWRKAGESLRYVAVV